MRRNLVIMCVSLAFATLLVGCDKEVKPTKPGVFVVTGKNLQEWFPVEMEEEFTAEGFIISYFYEDPTLTFRFRDSHVVLNGDYRPLKIRQYMSSGGRWVEDSSRKIDSDLLEVGQMKGEKQMFKVKILKEMRSGYYVMDVQRGDGKLESYAFRAP
jgi:hypothetical protein